jgi:hypothetical protein
MDELTDHNETQALAIPWSSPLPVWLDTSTPMATRRQALTDAMRPAHPQVRANILGLLSSRYPVSNTTDAGTLEMRAAALSDDLNDLPESVLREACRQAARSCRFMPLAAEIMEFANPLMDKLNGDRKHLDVVQSKPVERRPISEKPEYVDPATIGDALKFMHAKFAEADAKEGTNTRKVDYTQGPVQPAMPAIADASDELRAFAARRMA